jgi:hypothetical protein
MMRFAAVLLLTLMVLDISADFVHGENGDFAASLPTSSDSGSAIAASPSNHECFCCCSHLVQTVPVGLQISEESTASSIVVSLRLPEPAPVHIYHPPKHIL